MVKWIKNEFWNGYNLFERIFFTAMILLQIAVYYFIPDTIIGVVCGISGVVCVALTAKGRISSYIFNFIQMITYMVICWDARLFLEFGEQVFYFIACIFGVFVWKKHMIRNEDGTKQVKSRKFTLWKWVATIISTIVVTILLGYIGDTVLHSTLSYLDAFTVALAVIAQILMVFRYREQWFMWVIIDVSSLVMFLILGQWSMVAMYIAWTINALYGWYNWSLLEKSTETGTENIQCPFCRTIHKRKQPKANGLVANTFCSCGAKYYTKDGVWLSRHTGEEIRDR